MSQALRIRLTLSFVSACLAAVALYAILRVIQSRLFPEPNPALVVWSAHAGYFWRIWSVSYMAGMVGLLAFAASERQPARMARVLSVAVVAAGALIMLQGIFVP